MARRLHAIGPADGTFERTLQRHLATILVHLGQVSSFKQALKANLDDSKS